MMKNAWHCFLNKNASVISSAAFMQCVHSKNCCGTYHKICGSALLSLSSAAMTIKSEKGNYKIDRHYKIDEFLLSKLQNYKIDDYKKENYYIMMGRAQIVILSEMF